MLIRSTIVALNQANYTGNYTVLHALATPALQANKSPADLGIAFTSLRDQQTDFSPALVLPPELDEPPVVLADGQLRLVGHVPTQPLRITFSMAFRPVGGRWRIDELAVTTAPAPPPAATATPPPSLTPRQPAPTRPSPKQEPKKP